MNPFSIRAYEINMFSLNSQRYSFGGVNSMGTSPSMIHHVADSGSFEVNNFGSLTNDRHSAPYSSDSLSANEPISRGRDGIIRKDYNANLIQFNENSAVSSQAGNSSEQRLFVQHLNLDKSRELGALDSSRGSPTFSFGGGVTEHISASMASRAADTGSFQPKNVPIGASFHKKSQNSWDSMHQSCDTTDLHKSTTCSYKSQNLENHGPQTTSMEHLAERMSISTGLFYKSYSSGYIPPIHHCRERIFTPIQNPTNAFEANSSRCDQTNSSECMSQEPVYRERDELCQITESELCSIKNSMRENNASKTEVFLSFLSSHLSGNKSRKWSHEAHEFATPKGLRTGVNSLPNLSNEQTTTGCHIRDMRMHTLQSKIEPLSSAERTDNAHSANVTASRTSRRRTKSPNYDLESRGDNNISTTAFVRRDAFENVKEDLPHIGINQKGSGKVDKEQDSKKEARDKNGANNKASAKDKPGSTTGKFDKAQRKNEESRSNNSQESITRLENKAHINVVAPVNQGQVKPAVVMDKKKERTQFLNRENSVQKPYANEDQRASKDDAVAPLNTDQKSSPGGTKTLVNIDQKGSQHVTVAPMSTDVKGSQRGTVALTNTDHESSKRSTESLVNTDQLSSQRCTASSVNTDQLSSQRGTVAPVNTNQMSSQHGTASSVNTNQMSSQHGTVSSVNTDQMSSQNGTASSVNTDQMSSQHGTASSVNTNQRSFKKYKKQDWSRPANEILCIEDHPLKGKRYFAAYLCVAKADLERFGKDFHTEIEQWGFRILLPEKDLLASGFHLDNICAALEERCQGKIIIVLSKNFESSAECKFITQYARCLDPDLQKRNLIPVVIDNNCHIPRSLAGVIVINYEHNKKRGWLKKRMADAIFA
ncbi:myeloid differentiation primary response protein MyD88 [Elysia marginata]|uniref:Myeloid differentiation primary response protein MyD88 n=1 Tax=Elysia marginata TaxID=1093978 RepID=A0AAV4FDN2_9GAST|nr:myeloid differentiation primary response protein MyD88 [Elysia marginata]